MNRRFFQIGVSTFLLIFGAGLITIATLHSFTYKSDAARSPVSPSLAAKTKPASTTSPTPSPTPPTPPAVGKQAGSALGAQTIKGLSNLGIAAGSGLSQLSESDLLLRLDQIRALGVTWLRYDVEWANIEQAGPGQYNWTDYDRVTEAAAARGFRIIGILDYSPAWARLGACTDTSACAPADPNTYGAFAGVAARHFSRLGIHYWEIWNEPNNQNFFQPSADTARYTSMLKLAYQQIKGADPTSMVLTGGLAPEDSANGSISPSDFVTGMYQQGAKGSFDAVADHPYSFPFLVSRSNPDSAWGQMKSIHATMAANGDGLKKVWVTEFGAPTAGPGGGPVSESTQSLMLSDVIAQLRTYSWAGPLLWYSFKDAGTTSDTVENFFGLVRADGTKKPAYQLFASLTTTF